MLSYTRQIADFASSLKYSDIPAAVVARVKQLMLDGFGCALYAADVKWTQILANLIRRLEPNGGPATIWGRNETASATSAALINGTMVQGYELDDSHSIGSSHSCSVVLPAVLAACEYFGADKIDGKRLLTAVIAGFEIGPRVGLCIRSEQRVIDGWHAPAIIASFPAAAAAGSILGLSSDQLFQALGIAGTQASGLMAAQFGAMVKRMQCAKNSQSGLYAALLAADGFTGIENIFEEKYGGYCSTFTHSADQFDLPALTDGLKERWETMRAGIKVYACRGGNHTSVSAVEELMDKEGLKAEDVEEITVGVTQAMVSHSGWWPYEPAGLTAAQMHLGFCVAIQLIEGEVFVDQMVEENVARPDLIALANRVKVIRSLEREGRGEAYGRGADVKVRLKNGRILENTVDHRPGSDQRPITMEQVTKKFRRMASKGWSAEKISAFENIVSNIEHAASVTPLLNALGQAR